MPQDQEDLLGLDREIQLRKAVSTCVDKVSEHNSKGLGYSRQEDSGVRRSEQLRRDAQIAEQN